MMLTRTQSRTASASLLLATLALSGCGERATEADAPPEVEESAEAPVSILRPDVEQPTQQSAVLEPVMLTIGFPSGGSELGSDAVEALETLLQSDQMALGGPIRLGGHSDASGSDTANLDASQERALAVAAWLIENGIESDRIDVIVFGEQNPIEPNALPNGEPNEEGRAANRRVEIEVPTIALADSAEAESVEAGD